MGGPQSGHTQLIPQISIPNTATTLGTIHNRLQLKKNLNIFFTTKSSSVASTICPISSYPIYIVTYYIKWTLLLGHIVQSKPALYLTTVLVHFQNEA